MLLSLYLTSAFGLVTVLAAPTSTTCQSGELISGTTCKQECNLDRNGGDFNSMPVASLQECAQACNQDSRCLTAQYSRGNGWCYLKSSLNDISSNDGVDGVVCRQPVVPTTTTRAAPSCPSQAATYTASGGVKFEWKCNYDYYGADIRATYSVPTLETCLDQCAAEPECFKVTWVAEPQICYLKRDAESSDRMAEGMWGGKKIIASTSTVCSIYHS